MFEVLPFKVEHLEELKTQKINSFLPTWIAEGSAKALEGPDSFTGVQDGHVVVCGGIVKFWQGRGYLWTVFGEDGRNNFLPVFRNLERFLDNAPYSRLEVAVPCDLYLAKRRARMLGFELECERARKYFPDGADATLFVRLKTVGIA